MTTDRPAPVGITLAELDGTTFLLLAAPAVLAIRGDALAYYCTGEAWDATPAAREAAARAELATLRARVQELEARPAAAIPLALPAPARRRASTGPAPAPPLPLTDPCRHCRQRLPAKGKATLKMHERYCPQNPDRGEMASRRRKPALATGTAIVEAPGPKAEARP